jgi:tetratricopeptide (TPR) repeat protein/predicted Ser/Thr protein kinase
MSRTPSDEAAEPLADPTDVLVHSRVGRYLVLSKIGMGGMGVVYAAYDPELDRKVALKFLLAGSGVKQDQRRERLLREAQALAKFSHPEIVAIYDFGEHPLGVWLAMEFIDGRTLSAWAGEARRSWREVLNVMLAAGRGVAAAHAASLVHRDLKPDNIMIGHDGRVRVMDFGLTRAVGRETPTPAGAPVHADEIRSLKPLTRRGKLLGTPAYMASEQFSQLEITAAADQFSFCVTLWELLFGQRPFDGRTTRELATAVLNGQLRTPPRRRGVPTWLQRVCERGLASAPEARWPSMQALLEQLDRGQTRGRVRMLALGLGLVACVAAAGEGYRRFELGQRIAACEAEGATIGEVWNDEARILVHEAIMGSNASYAADTADKVMPWLNDYARTWQVARTTACVSASVNERDGWDADMLDRSLWCLDERRMELAALVSQLESGDALVVTRAVKAAAGLGRIDPCMDEDLLARLPVPPVDGREQIRVVRAELSRALALRAMGDFKASLVIARESLERAEALDWPPLSALARYRVGALLTDTAQFEESATVLKDAYFEASNAGVPEVESDAAAALVFTLGVRLARHAEGREWFRHAERALSTLPDPLQLREALLLGHLASVEFGAGAYERAMQLQRRSLALREQALGSNHPDIWSPLGNLALIHEKLGEYEQARALHERVLAFVEDELGPQHPDMGSILNNLSENYRMTGEYAEAKQLSERGLSIKELALGPEHPSVANSLGNLALVLEGMGSYAEAQPMLERVVAIKQAALGPEHPDVASTLNNLAENHRKLGEDQEALAQHQRALSEYQEALTLHQRALAIKESVLGPNHTSTGLSLTNLAIVYQALDEHEQAKAHFERALGIFERELGDKHAHVSYPLLGLAEIALEQQRAADALPLAERGLVLRDQPGSPPRDVADARFILARALWETGGSRSRAHDLAMQARASFQAEDASKSVGEVDAWLASHELER